MGFKTLEQTYWDLKVVLKLTTDIVPLNLEQEKEKFLTHKEKGLVYNPVFDYAQNTNADRIPELECLKNQFNVLNEKLSPAYIELIDKDIAWINGFGQRNEVGFSGFLSDLFGKPSEDLLQQAQDILDNYKKEADLAKTISSEEALTLFSNELKAKGFHTWTVTVENSAAGVTVESLKQNIKIKSNFYFSPIAIERLFVHEIGTHVSRSENGKEQDSLLYRYGFPNYIETEEGLAIYNEERSGLLSEFDKLRYALRVVGSHKAFDMNFYCLQSYLSHYLSESGAFDMAARIKRGFVNTDSLGGYTKDQIYLSGYYLVKKLGQLELNKLMIGKIGVKQLQLENK